MMVALTVVTGIVDAVSYLRLGHVFVANMTGNVVFLGFALAGAAGLSSGASLAAIAAFLAGAFAGGRLAARTPAHRGFMLRSATFAQASLLALALVLALTASSPLQEGMRYALLVALALAMGVQNSAAQRLAVPELTTTVLTRTLTGIASEAGLGGARGSDAARWRCSRCSPARSSERCSRWKSRSPRRSCPPLRSSSSSQSLCTSRRAPAPRWARA